MKHYPHHIGDFDKATRHLTRLERSVYRDLIDLYYDTEQRLTLDMAALCRRIIARSNEEATAVEQVLNEFFTETPTGWYHDRCEEEIEAYKANASQKAMAGKASAEAKRLKKERALNGDSTAVEQPLKSVETEAQRNSTNQSTNNQEPITNTPKAPTGAEIRFERFWAAYPKKVGKDAAKRSFEKRKVDSELLNTMLAALLVQKNSAEWVRDGGQFIPHPSTWLSQGRWQDEGLHVDSTPINPMLAGAI